MNIYTDQIKLGRIINVMNAGGNVHDVKVIDIVGPKVLVEWDNMSQWVPIKKIAKSMERAHFKRIEESNAAYQSGAYGWD